VVEIAVSQFITFVLVLTRISGLMLFAPIFGSSNVPPQAKIGLSAVLSFIVFPALPATSLAVPMTVGGLAIAAVEELAVGVVIGFAASLLFAGFQLAGHLVGQQMGLALAAVFNPQFEEQTSVLGEFYFFLAMVLFVLMNGHHLLLSAVLSSFRLVPVAGVQFPPELPAKLSVMFGEIFSIGLRIAAPAVLALLLSSVALGFIARTVPQMNLLIIGFPLRIGLGLAVVVISLPLMIAAVTNVLGSLEDSLYTLVYLMRG